MKLIVGNKYKFHNGKEILEYLGVVGPWYQFALEGTAEVWAEIFKSDLYMIKKV